MGEQLLVWGLVDVTARRQLERQLQQAQKMDAVGRLAGGIAHEFNNKLGVILGHTERLLRNSADGQRGGLEQILKATRHASGLTRQLLAFSRKQVVHPIALDLGAFLVDLEKMLGRLMGEDISFMFVPGAERTRVKMDPGQLEQVLINLCVNARDAMPKGGALRLEASNVEVGATEGTGPIAPGPYVMLTIADTGDGIEEQAVSRVFEPFFTTREVGRGTGLGLAVVYGLVKDAGGYVSVESAPGRGTTFTIHLPRLTEAIEEDAVPSTSRPTGTGETILLVEDEIPLRSITRDALVEKGYRVLEAATGAEAVAIAAASPAPIHLLITDLVMPGMDGRTLAAALAGTRSGLRVLYMSGYAADVLVDRGLREGETKLLKKPFEVATLLHRVHTVLEAA
jgi:nitrogen-specific signal transduction histidine kinase